MKKSRERREKSTKKGKRLRGLAWRGKGVAKRKNVRSSGHKWDGSCR
jgi:hypothetical protein